MDIVISTLRAVAITLTSSYFIFLLFILSIALYRQNRKITLMQKIVLGENINSAFELTISQIVLGIFGGVLGSLILSFLGISFTENSSVELIFFMSIILMLIKPRFICFAYSGAALGGISIILDIMSRKLNDPSIKVISIDIGTLMALVAVFHFVEGILIFLDGSRGAVPVFSGRGEKVVGGFAFKRYWVVPMAVIFFTMDNLLIEGGIKLSSIPNWWSTFGFFKASEHLKGMTLAIFPFLSVIGYSSVTFTRSKRQKTCISGLLNIVYSLVLLAVSYLSKLGIVAQILLVIFAPLAHEGMIYLSRYMEIKGKPKYMSSEEGIMVLATTPNSTATKMGINTGDLILEVNNEKVNNELQVINLLKNARNYIELKIKTQNGILKKLSSSELEMGQKLGLLLVPRFIPKDIISCAAKTEEKSFEKILQQAKMEKLKEENKGKVEEVENILNKEKEVQKKEESQKEDKITEDDLKEKEDKESYLNK